MAEFGGRMVVVLRMCMATTPRLAVTTLASIPAASLHLYSLLLLGAPVMLQVRERSSTTCEAGQEAAGEGAPTAASDEARKASAGRGRSMAVAAGT